MEIAGGILTGMATNATMFAVWAGVSELATVQ